MPRAWACVGPPGGTNALLERPRRTAIIWYARRPVTGAELYLQIEERRLAAKLAVEEKPRTRELREQWARVVAAELDDLGFRRPRRLANGTFLTIGECSRYLQKDRECFG